MIKFENTDVLGWEHAIRGMRNPMNSWDKSDSYLHECICDTEVKDGTKEYSSCYIIGGNDLDLMKRLREAGTDHRKYLRMITVYVDITAPLYWWKEFDQYRIGVTTNSCSTMHKITDKEFTLDDFSHEHLAHQTTEVLRTIIDDLNDSRSLYLKTKNKGDWWQMIQLLPSSYNQKRTVMMNYEVLNNIYKSRKNHKLDEWSIDFMKWIESLPYAKELIIGD